MLSLTFNREADDLPQGPDILGQQCQAMSAAVKPQGPAFEQDLTNG